MLELCSPYPNLTHLTISRLEWSDNLILKTEEKELKVMKKCKPLSAPPNTEITKVKFDNKISKLVLHRFHLSYTAHTKCSDI